MHADGPSARGVAGVDDSRAKALVGCASWSIPGALGDRFPGAGPHLMRYAARLPVVEINSSFHRPHRPGTYARWAAAVGPSFRFSVKVPKDITHGRRLVDVGGPLGRFLDETAALGGRRGPLLVQLPPSLAFDADVVERFLVDLGARHGGRVVCEPRHPSWFETDAEELLVRLGVARVAADPAPVPAAALPGGWPGFVYRRLHGSPVTYRSSYDDATIAGVAGAMRDDVARGVESWCIFDNTASGAAAGNALSLTALLREAGAPHDG